MFLVAVILLLFHVSSFAWVAVTAVRMQRHQMRWQADAGRPPDGISVILPIKGLDPGAEEHYRRWLSQSVAVPYEVIFSLQDASDPVLPLLERLLRAHPQTPAHIIINPIAPGLNGKSSNLMHGVAAARYEYLVMADSDIVPPTDILSRIVVPLADPQVGEVACLPVIGGATNLWGGMTAHLLNLAMVMNWGMQEATGRVVAASGACFAIRKATLARLGGIAAFGGYVAEDAELCRQLTAAGLKVVTGPLVPLEQGDGSLAALLGLQARAALLTFRWYGPSEAFTTLVGVLLPFAVLVPGLAFGQWPVVLAVLGSVIVRMCLMAVLQYACDPGGRFRYLWVYPLVEVTNLVMFIITPVTNRLTWRGVTYRVEKGGRLQVVSSTPRR